MENNKSFTDRIIEGLHKTLAEVEELQVQASLGKTEAKQLISGFRDRFNDYIQEAKVKFKDTSTIIQENSSKIKEHFDAIEKIINTGVTDSMNSLGKQKDSVSHLISDLENSVKDNKSSAKIYNDINLEIEKFKLKLELIKMKYNLDNHF